MTAPDSILRLVEHFDSTRSELVSASYNETQIRREFIDPFFTALGWDIDNRQGAAEAYKDVIHEDAIRIGSATKAPDYAFRIGGARKFFVEAKKPAVNIKEDVGPAFQLRRYAWSAKLPVSILTDFDELAVYDCRIKPNKTDKSTTARIKYLTYKDYVPHWEEIASVFSKDAVWNGSFDKYVVGTKGKKGADEVDDAFLKEIESWRDVLARNIALRNPKLTVRELNFAVQRTIDRIIFLRICEDRGIETYGGLQALANGDRIYRRLGEMFQRADEKYNSGLFHFAEERGRPESPDSFTLGLKIDDKPLKEILAGLYYPDCPYEFSILPADILGQVYEQFLGKVIRLTAGHQAKVEEKPEVKKAGGVYYTPTYIVDYIVRNTVGKLVEEKTPKQVASLRVLDPACGSGSFLIGAYQYLLDWHHTWYTQDSTEKWSTGKNATLYSGPGGVWRLTTAERKRILLNNIYGVDIDSQAVEVTKLSLLLKVLEGENEETINQQLRMFHERALPDLGSNIKCGNSLIGPDFFDGKLIVDAEERTRINAFDWKVEFKEIMERGGFDAVIGNPPYIRIQAMKEWAPSEVRFYKSRYKSAGLGNYDIYVVFAERGLELLSATGNLGYILPHKFFTSQYGGPLRSLISDRKCLRKIVHFGDQQVFADATTYTCLMFLDGSPTRDVEATTVADLMKWKLGEVENAKVIAAERIGSTEWELSSDPFREAIDSLQKSNPSLGELAHIFVGTQTSADDVFVLENCRISKGQVFGYSESLNREVKIERDIVVPFLRGKDIRRYSPLISETYLICPYRIGPDDFSLFDENELRDRYPLAHAFLKDNRKALAKREKGRLSGEKWFAFGYPKSMTLFQRAKIIVPDYNNVASFTQDLGGHFYKTGYGILVKDTAVSDLYLLGLLNSSLLFKILCIIGTSLRGGYVRFWSQYVEKLPIRKIDFHDPEDRLSHDNMVEMVESMLQLHKDIAQAKTDQEKTALRRQIDATDKQIDALVYELYGLTEEEIRIVEGKS